MTGFIDFIVSTVWPWALALILKVIHKVPVTSVALAVGLWQARSCLKSLGKVSTSSFAATDRVRNGRTHSRRRRHSATRSVTSAWARRGGKRVSP